MYCSLYLGFWCAFSSSFLALFLVSSVFLLTALGTGLLVSGLTRNQFVSSQISIVISFLPAFMLSGFIFEFSSMPMFVRVISYIIPARYMVTSLQTLFLVGNVWRLILSDVLVMLLMVIVLFALIFARTVKRLD